MSAPTVDELLAALQRLHVEQPGLGVGKVHAQIKKTFPEWSVSSKVYCAFLCCEAATDDTFHPVMSTSYSIYAIRCTPTLGIHE